VRGAGAGASRARVRTYVFHTRASLHKKSPQTAQGKAARPGSSHGVGSDGCRLDQRHHKSTSAAPPTGLGPRTRPGHDRPRPPRQTTYMSRPVFGRSRRRREPSRLHVSPNGTRPPGHDPDKTGAQDVASHSARRLSRRSSRHPPHPHSRPFPHACSVRRRTVRRPISLRSRGDLARRNEKTSSEAVVSRPCPGPCPAHVPLMSRSCPARRITTPDPRRRRSRARSRLTRRTKRSTAVCTSRPQPQRAASPRQAAPRHRGARPASPLRRRPRSRRWQWCLRGAPS